MRASLHQFTDIFFGVHRFCLLDAFQRQWIIYTRHARTSEILERGSYVGPRWPKRTSTRCVTTWTKIRIVNFCTRAVASIHARLVCSGGDPLATSDPVLTPLCMGHQGVLCDSRRSFGFRCLYGPTVLLSHWQVSHGPTAVRLCHREGSCVRFRTLRLLGQPMCDRRSFCRTCLQVQALAPTRNLPPARCLLLKRRPHGTKTQVEIDNGFTVSLVTREAINSVDGAGL